MADILDFQKKTSGDEHKPMHYDLELRTTTDEVEKASAFGLLSFGSVFVSIIKDEKTPIIMVPYDRVLSIRATPEIAVAGSA